MRKNTIGSLALASALAWVAASSVQAGWVDQTFYPDAIVQGTIGSQTPSAPAGSLYGLGNFPNDPTLFGYSGLLMTQISNGDQFAPADSVEGGRNVSTTYGSMIQGFLEAPVTGAYTIWVTGFQDTELWMITNAFTANMDINPRSPSYAAKRVAYLAPVANSHPAAASRVYNTWLPTQRSRKINLVKGSVYFFRIVQANSVNGGDHCSIGWLRPDLVSERPVPTRYTQRVTPPPSGFGNFYFDQQLLSSAPIIVQQAGNIFSGTGAVAANNPGNPYSSIGYGTTSGEFRVKEKTKSVLFVNVEGTQPMTYQWAKGGSPIAGAILSSLDVTNDTISSGETYTCTISGVGTPAVATINLITEQDNTPPYVTSAATLGNPTGLSVFFSEPITPASATNINNYKINVATVTKAELQYGTNQMVVILTTTAFTGANPVLTVTNIVDIATTPNDIKNDPQRRWSVPIGIVDGIVLKESYYGITGDNQVQRIYDLARWRVTPDASEYISSFECPDQPARDNWGSEVRGVLIPSETADYVFYISADDEAVLYLSSDDNPVNKRMITIEPQWNNYRDWPATARRGINDWAPFTRTQQGVGYSIPDAIADPCNRSDNIPHGFTDPGGSRINLEAGRKYYIEAAFKDGGGGGHMAVTWTKAGEPTPANGDASTLTQQYLGLAQAGTIGPLLLTKSPTNITVQERFTANFTADATGSQIIRYQWYEVGPGGVPVILPDDTLATLSIPGVQFADTGRTFYCIIYNSFSKTSSSNATLNVVQDNTPPAFYRAVGSPNTNTVKISFSEPVNASTVNASSFRITRTIGGAVMSGVNLINVLPDRTNVLLSFPHNYGTNYTITHVGSIKDEADAQNALPPNAVVTFTGFVQSRGWLTAEEYWNIGGGTSVPDLTGSTKFISKLPDRYRAVSLYESHPSGDLTSVGGTADNYGERIWGWIIPPTSGNYTFYCCADDGAQLWLSSSSDPTPKTQIAYEPTWNDGRQWVQNDRRNAAAPENRSAPQNLSAGTAYYTEFMFKEGGGGDNGAVTWQAPGQPVPDNGSAPLIGNTYVMSYQNPDGTSITFSQNTPATIVTNEVTQLTFTVAAIAAIYDNNNAPKLYQWQVASSNAPTTFVDIAGANGPTYTTPFLLLNQNQIRYRCMVYTIGKAVPSTTTLVTLNSDSTPPTITSVGSTPIPNRIRVAYSKAPVVSQATTTSKYTIPGLTVLTAVMDPNGKDVILTTSTQTNGATYNVTVTGVQDLAWVPNMLSPNPTTKSFTPWNSGGVLRETWFNISGGMNGFLADARFLANNPDRIDYVPRLQSYPSGWGDAVSNCGWAPGNPGGDGYADYGVRLTTYLIVPTTGDYIFAGASDDGHRVYLSTDENPANKRMILGEAEWNDFRNFSTRDRRGHTESPFINSPTNNWSVPITLQAGKAYYIEAVLNEGGGGDGVSVAITGPGLSTIPDWWDGGVLGFVGWDSASDRQFVRKLVDPAVAPTFTQQPAGGTIFDGQAFNLTAKLRIPYNPASYKWQYSTNGGSSWVDYPGASGGLNGNLSVEHTASLSIPAGTLDLSWSGAMARLLVTLPGNSSMASSTATVTVLPPSLTITKSGANAIVSWPQTPTYKLQSTGEILPTGTAWADETNDIYSAGNVSTKTNSTAGGTNQVFRLMKP